MKKIAILMLMLVVSGCITVETKGSEPEIKVIPPSTLKPARQPGDSANFNLEIDLPQSYQQIAAGDELWFTTKLLNLANQERIDVTLSYNIFDAQRQLKHSQSETVAVETQASFVANLQTPENLINGLHFLEVNLDSPMGKSTAETTFEVTAVETEPQITIKFSLFDIQVEIPEDYKNIFPGEELLTSIKLINVGSGGRIDIFLDYWITDAAGEIILAEKETVAVETQNNFVRTFVMPSTVKPGRYTFHAKVSYPGLELEPEYATMFTVDKRKVDSRILIIGFSLIAVLILVLISLRMHNFKAFFEKRLMSRKVKKMVNSRKS
jgi:hypothetical protein